MLPRSNATGRAALGSLLFLLLVWAFTPGCVREPTPEERLIRAVWQQDQAAVKVMLEAGTSPDARLANPKPKAALVEAARVGDLGMVELLLDAGASVDLTESAGFGAPGQQLDYRDGVTALQAAIYNKRVEVVELLLEHGADVNVQDQSMLLDTPLTLAIYGDLGLVELLLDAGADVSAKCWKDRTPLHIAASANGIDVAILQRLLDAGAELNALDELGLTPLDVARQADARALLEQAGGERSR